MADGLCWFKCLFIRITELFVRMRKNKGAEMIEYRHDRGMKKVFKVRPSSMAEAAASMKLLSKQLNIYQDELGMTRRSLQTLSYMDEPCKSIQRSQNKLERLSSQMLQAVKVMDMIRQEYQQRENAVIHYCEESNIKNRER